MSSVISILCRASNLAKELRVMLPNFTFKEIQTDSDHSQLAKSEIIIADFDLLLPHLDILKPKWIQGTWAGVDILTAYRNHDIFNSAIITRFSGKHFGRLMSEYVVSNIVNHERDLFKVYDNSKQSNWSREGRIFEHRSLADLTVGILGVGNIGNYIAKTLHTFGTNILGFGRRESLPNSEYEHYTKYYTVHTLPQLLMSCDYLVNVLPNTDETTGLLNGGILKNCEDKGTVFINIGRGSIINETDLIEALDKKWISAAILDVFDKEPLPEDNRLWTYEQVLITPHVAGVSRAADIAEQFKENLILYQNGQKIPTQLLVGNKY